MIKQTRAPGIISSEIQLNEKDHRINKMIQTISALSNLNFCKQILMKLDSIYKNNPDIINPVLTNTLDENRLISSSLYFSFIITYMKLFTNRGKQLHYSKSDAYKFFNNDKALIEAHDQIEEIRHTFVGHAGPTIAEKIHVQSIFLTWAETISGTFGTNEKTVDIKWEHQVESHTGKSMLPTEEFIGRYIKMVEILQKVVNFKNEKIKSGIRNDYIFAHLEQIKHKLPPASYSALVKYFKEEIAKESNATTRGHGT